MTDAPHAATAPVADLVGFTEGPWKYTPRGNGYLVTRSDVFVVGHGICALNPSQAANEDQCEANARLIASAPTLYADNKQLREIIAELVAALEPFADATLTPNGAVIGLMREDFERARATLARAAAFNSKGAP